MQTAFPRQPVPATCTWDAFGRLTDVVYPFPAGSGSTFAETPDVS